MSVFIAPIIRALRRFDAKTVVCTMIFFVISILGLRAQQCAIHNLRPGSPNCSASSMVVMEGSTVGNAYQLVRNGTTLVGDVVQGTGASTMQWIVSEAGTYTVVAYGGACSGGTLMSGSTMIVDLGPTVAVTINAQNSNSVCQGQTVSFTAQNCTGCTWYRNGASTGVTGSTYTPSTDQTGTSTITVSGFNPCHLYQSDDVALTVEGTPPVTIVPQGATTICEGSSVVLQGQTTGVFFEWLRDGQPISNATTVAYTATVAGSYALRTSFTATGCKRTSAAVSVNVIPKPQASILPTGEVAMPASQGSTRLTANGDGGLTYQWYRDSQVIVGAIGVTYDAAISGNYTVQTKTAQGCSNTSPATRLTVENNYNYVIVQELLVEKKADGSPITEADLSGLSKEQEGVSTTYFDGLGRPMQTVQKRSSPNGYDVVLPVVYDPLGREAVKYLPYVSNQANGYYKINALGQSELDYPNSPQSKFYNAEVEGDIASDDSPFAKTIFESSPLNRVQKQGAPGEMWQPNANASDLNDKTIKKRYNVNTTDDAIYLFQYNQATDQLTIGNGLTSFYAPGALHATITIDENKNEVIEYADKQGKTICKRVQFETVNNEKHYANTYYVYDDKDQLTIVLPPEALVEILKQH